MLCIYTRFLLQILVITQELGHCLDECHFLHLVAPFPAFPFHIHFRIVGDATLRRVFQLSRRNPDLKLQYNHECLVNCVPGKVSFLCRDERLTDPTLYLLKYDVKQPLCLRLNVIGPKTFEWANHRAPLALFVRAWSWLAMKYLNEPIIECR